MITIYSSNCCNECRQAKEWFDSKGVKYEVKDLDIKENLLRAMDLCKGNYKLPLVVWGEGSSEETISGFDTEKYERMAAK